MHSESYVCGFIYIFFFFSAASVIDFYTHIIILSFVSDICVHHVLLVVYDTNKVLPYIWEHLISGFFHFSRHIFLVSTLYPEAPWGTEIICFSVAGFTGVMELQCAPATGRPLAVVISGCVSVVVVLSVSLTTLNFVSVAVASLV